MADRFPLIVDSDNSNVKELPSGDNLNLTGNDAIFGDNDKAVFGAGSDLQIYHDGSNSYIQDANGTGNLVLGGRDLTLQDYNTGEPFITCVNNNAVTLYYDNNAKLATTSGGVTVTGTVYADGVQLGDNENIYIGASQDLRIYHDGSNSYVKDVGTGNLYLSGTNIRIGNAGETANYLLCDDGGSVRINYNGATKLETTSYGVDISGSAVADTHNVSSASGAYVQNFDTYQHFKYEMSGNVTLNNPTTEKAGQSGHMIFIQDATGGRTLSLGSDYETVGGAGITLSSAANATDIVPYVVLSSGRILLGTPQLAFS